MLFSLKILVQNEHMELVGCDFVDYTTPVVKRCKKNGYSNDYVIYGTGCP